MSDLSRYVEMYRMTTEHDTEVLWSKVNIIRTAIADGADVETLLSECGKESGDSRKQVRKFYAVAMVFPLDGQAKDIDYWTYEVCATAPGVDPENDSTHDIAFSWLRTATWGREIKRGKKTIYAKHTARTLRAAIRKQTASEKPKAETVYRGEATVDWTKQFTYMEGADTETTVVLVLKGHHVFTQDETVTVTITRSPQPETENAAVAAEGSAA